MILCVCVCVLDDLMDLIINSDEDKSMSLHVL